MQELVAPFGLGISLPGFGVAANENFPTTDPVLGLISDAFSTGLTAVNLLAPPISFDFMKELATQGTPGLIPTTLYNPKRPSQTSPCNFRRLLGQTSSCGSGVEAAVSTSQSADFSVEMSTSEDPAMVDGDGDMFLMVTTDIIVSLSWVVKKNTSSACAGALPPYQAQSASLNPNKQLLWVSQWQIKNQIMPQSQSLLNYIISTVGAAYNNTDPLYTAVSTNLANWQWQLDFNAQLKQTAVPWPDLLEHLVLVGHAQPAQLGPGFDVFCLLAERRRGRLLRRRHGRDVLLRRHRCLPEQRPQLLR